MKIFFKQLFHKLQFCEQIRVRKNIKLQQLRCLTSQILMDVKDLQSENGQKIYQVEQIDSQQINQLKIKQEYLKNRGINVYKQILNEAIFTKTKIIVFDLWSLLSNIFQYFPQLYQEWSDFTNQFAQLQDQQNSSLHPFLLMPLQLQFLIDQIIKNFCGNLEVNVIIFFPQKFATPLTYKDKHQPLQISQFDEEIAKLYGQNDNCPSQMFNNFQIFNNIMTKMTNYLIFQRSTNFIHMPWFNDTIFKKQMGSFQFSSLAYQINNPSKLLLFTWNQRSILSLPNCQAVIALPITQKWKLIPSSSDFLKQSFSFDQLCIYYEGTQFLYYNAQTSLSKQFLRNQQIMFSVCENYEPKKSLELFLKGNQIFYPNDYQLLKMIAYQTYLSWRYPVKKYILPYKQYQKWSLKRLKLSFHSQKFQHWKDYFVQESSIRNNNNFHIQNYLTTSDIIIPQQVEKFYVHFIVFPQQKPLHLKKQQEINTVQQKFQKQKDIMTVKYKSKPKQKHDQIQTKYGKNKRCLIITKKVCKKLFNDEQLSDIEQN